jgi:hypothetical protein
MARTAGRRTWQPWPLAQARQIRPATPVVPEPGPGRQSLLKQPERRKPNRRSGRDPGRRPYAPAKSKPGRQGRKHCTHPPCRLCAVVCGSCRSTGCAICAVGHRVLLTGSSGRHHAGLAGLMWGTTGCCLRTFAHPEQISHYEIRLYDAGIDLVRPDLVMHALARKFV